MQIKTLPVYSKLADEKEIPPEIAARLPDGWKLSQHQLATYRALRSDDVDVVIVRGERRHYHDRHPGPDDLALMVEVSDTTLVRDRALKLRLYATAGVGCSWIVNLVERQVEVYTAPSGPNAAPHYAQRTTYQSGALIPLALDGAAVDELAVKALLP